MARICCSLGFLTSVCWWVTCADFSPDAAITCADFGLGTADAVNCSDCETDSLTLLQAQVVSPAGRSLIHNFALAIPFESANKTYFWDVVIAIFATALTSFGLVLQKLSHTLNEKSQKAVVYYWQPLWLLGFTIFMLAQIANLLPMTTAPQVMLSCLGATALIFNAIFASIILREELHLFEVAIMLGLVCGVVMVICTTPLLVEDSAHVPSLNEIVEPLFTMRFIIVAGVSLYCCLVVLPFAVNSELASRWPDLYPTMWTICAAVASGYTVNLFKAVAEFFAVFHHSKPHLHWECYLIVLTACFLGAVQVHALNRALNLGRAMLVVPTYCALGLLSQLVISELVVVVLPDNTVHRVVFASGVIVIVLFIVLLARAKIAYEEEPDAEFEDVIVRALSIKSSQRKLSSGEMNSNDSSPLRRRSMSSWDCEAFPDSFNGRERAYTVSVIGLGIA